jgi:5-(carboxyamino)imidazole ribonucleotide synthase
VDHLQAPARITATQAQDAQTLAMRVVDGLDSPGVFAVELFLTPDGRLLVNETAPRAHNSGHHTIEACASSQFDQLLRVYMDWPLGDTRLKDMAAMINLVGTGGTGAPQLNGADDILHIPGTYIHLYGKKETRTGRKMGHVTVVAASQHELDQAISVTKVHGRVVPLTVEGGTNE